jgi:hypothetical protein
MANLSGFGRAGRLDLTDQLLARLIHADHGKAGVVGQPIDVQDIFHRSDKGRVSVGRGPPTRVEAAVKSDIPGFMMGLADQSCLQTFFDQPLFDVLHGSGADAQSGRHIGHFPRITIITRIAQEQGAGVEIPRCRVFPPRVSSVRSVRLDWVRVTLYRLARPEMTPTRTGKQYELSSVPWY